MDGWVDVWIDGWMNGWMDGWVDELMNGKRNTRVDLDAGVGRL